MTNLLPLHWMQKWPAALGVVFQIESVCTVKLTVKGTEIQEVFDTRVVELTVKLSEY